MAIDRSLKQLSITSCYCVSLAEGAKAKADEIRAKHKAALDWEVRKKKLLADNRMTEDEVNCCRREETPEEKALPQEDRFMARIKEAVACSKRREEKYGVMTEGW